MSQHLRRQGPWVRSWYSTDWTDLEAKQGTKYFVKAASHAWDGRHRTFEYRPEYPAYPASPLPALREPSQIKLSLRSDRQTLSLSGGRTCTCIQHLHLRAPTTPAPGTCNQATYLPTHLPISPSPPFPSGTDYRLDVYEQRFYHHIAKFDLTGAVLDWTGLDWTVYSASTYPALPTYLLPYSILQSSSPLSPPSPVPSLPSRSLLPDHTPTQLPGVKSGSE
ncbi:hypothetical protein BKA65DRAFT_571195 [Rhexocercosporidium sp. MPI-PUGE-AT-0058]|nr:hypothetical protein BKA65DRAFT_571195 [Rhexocercosporidium sp. MPI-PUGE-AT-0058]